MVEIFATNEGTKLMARANELMESAHHFRTNEEKGKPGTAYGGQVNQNENLMKIDMKIDGRMKKKGQPSK